jgi:Arc/MetJ-type ribon-helix-helix transcriptional regulator
MITQPITRTIAVRIGPELLEKMNDLKMILRTNNGRIPSDSEIIRRALELYAEKYLDDVPQFQAKINL